MVARTLGGCVGRDESRPYAWLLCLLLLVGCGAAATQTVATVRTPIPSTVTEASYGDALRSFFHLRFDDPARARLRAQMIAIVGARTARLAEIHDYPKLVEQLFELTQLYTPEELAESDLAPELEAVAKLVVEHGEARGDEGRVLSGLLIQRSIHRDQPEFAAAYARLATWGEESRMGLAGLGPLENYEGLVSAWEEHVRLTPTSEAMEALARLYMERRDALIQLFQQSDEQLPLSSMVFQGVQRTVLDVAGVFLARGDLAAAHRHVSALATGNGIERRLADAIELAREDSAAGAGAMLDLARSYLEGGRSDVALGMCRYGLRQMPNDPRFHQCLARTAAITNDYAGAMAWYAEAVALAPDERPLYDEILEVLGNLIEQGLMATDPTGSRRLGARAIEILKQRTERWPDSPTPISPADLYLAIGVSEMNAGNAPEAEARLRESLAAQDSVKTLLQLGLLLTRTERGDDAIAVYQRALAQTPADDPRQSHERAQILEQLGDAQRASGHADQSVRTYSEALELWNVTLSGLRGPAIGLAQVRRGVLLDRLDRHADAVAAFEQAIMQAPAIRDVYATILTYFVASGTDHEFANRVFRRAQVQMDLAPEWKVYFALWLRSNATRQGLPDDIDAHVTFEDLSSGDGWWGRLARFGAGTLPYAQLLQEASSIGERTEAHFYEALRVLAAGKTSDADALLRQVIETRMINFYEYAMAHELLAAGTTTITATPTTATEMPQSNPTENDHDNHIAQ